MIEHIKLPTLSRTIRTVRERNGISQCVPDDSPRIHTLAVNFIRHGPMHYDRQLAQASSQEQKIKVLVDTYVMIAVNYPTLAEEATRQLHQRLQDAAKHGGYYMRKERTSYKERKDNRLS